jgi:small subunit ribosomal protein S6
MKKYEIMYILKADLDEAARKNEISKLQGILESKKAKVTDVKEWGVKDFAYVIKEQTKGYYVVLKVSADADALNEFSRLAKLDVNVIRHLITVDQD